MIFYRQIGKGSSEVNKRSLCIISLPCSNNNISLTEICFEDAIISAKSLDGHLAQHHKPIGPLHGIPTTLKDQFNIRGYDTTLGYVGRASLPAEEDCALVQMLRSLGAVILAKTNLPQSIMWCETENPLWGLTTNPYDSRYTPGGSTGGEAALIARGASVLGFGTDIGGSIRIPSHMMGIYGLKPSVSIPIFRQSKKEEKEEERFSTNIKLISRVQDSHMMVYPCRLRAKSIYLLLLGLWRQA